MAIQTQQSFSGFVASDPQLSRTENGDARLYMKVGKEHYRQEQDGSFTQLETTFHNLVAFKAAAEGQKRKHVMVIRGDLSEAPVAPAPPAPPAALEGAPPAPVAPVPPEPTDR